MIGPTLLLWLSANAYVVVQSLADGGGNASAGLNVVSRWAVAMAATTWVVRDAQKRGRRLCYDYGMFLLFGWPVVAPVYLFQTRGARACITLLCFIGIWLLAGLSVGAAIALRELLSP